MRAPRSVSTIRRQHCPAGVVQYAGPIHIIEDTPDIDRNHQVILIKTNINFLPRTPRAPAAARGTSPVTTPPPAPPRPPRRAPVVAKRAKPPLTTGKLTKDLITFQWKVNMKRYV